MTARYGDRSRVTSPVGSWGRDAVPSVKEVIVTANPAPALTVTPVIFRGVEYMSALVGATCVLTVDGPNEFETQFFLAAGGGGGNRSPIGPPGSSRGGAGGAGGLNFGIETLAPGNYPVTIGGGGGAFGGDGSDSSWNGLTMTGGGGGGSSSFGSPGGSGGGAGRPPPFVANRPGGAGIPGQGFPGGNALSGLVVNSGGGGGSQSAGGRTSVLGAGFRLSDFNYETGNVVYSQGGSFASSGDPNTGFGGGAGDAGTPPGLGGSGLLNLRYRRFQ